MQRLGKKDKSAQGLKLVGGPRAPLTLNFLIGPAPVFTKDFGYPLGFPFKLSFEPSGNTPNRPSPQLTDPQLAPQLGINPGVGPLAYIPLHKLPIQPRPYRTPPSNG